jgi:hypothetical protein
LIQQKRMQAMAERDPQDPLRGPVQVDDASLGGEQTGGKVGRGSENKGPLVAAVSLNAEGHPMDVNRAPVPGFTRTALGDGAKANLSPGCRVISEGLACCAGVIEADGQHPPLIVGTRKPKDLPEFKGINPI